MSGEAEWNDTRTMAAALRTGQLARFWPLPAELSANFPEIVRDR
ncbi:hypothetical protein OG729_14890 [Streptomyces sp. NBC_00210]